MTYASDLGLKVGSKIKVIDSNPHSPKDMYNHNDILLFVEDTGEKCSKFHNLTTGDDNCWFTFQDRTNCTMTWEHYKEPVKVTPKLVWKEMTLEEVKAVQVGDKIRIDGVENEVTYTFNKVTDFGFRTTGERKHFENNWVTDIVCSDTVAGMEHKFEKLVDETGMSTRLERHKEYDVRLTGGDIAHIFLLTGYAYNMHSLYNKVATLLGTSGGVIGVNLPPVNLFAEVGYKDAMNKLLAAPETEDQRKLRELKEQYESLGKAIEAMEKK